MSNLLILEHARRLECVSPHTKMNSPFIYYYLETRSYFSSSTLCGYVYGRAFRPFFGENRACCARSTVTLNIHIVEIIIPTSY